MSRIYLIRHARPAAAWGGNDDDPGLDDVGQAQAQTVAETLLALPSEVRPTRVASSPLRRCHETALPFADAIGASIEIDPAVGEIPTPAGLASEARGPWLQQALTGRWSDIVGDIDYERWRRSVAAAVAGRPQTAVFSHFVAINAILSALTGEDSVVGFRPDHTSMSTLELSGGGLRLVERGREATTRVL